MPTYKRNTKSGSWSGSTGSKNWSYGTSGKGGTYNYGKGGYWGGSTGTSWTNKGTGWNKNTKNWNTGFGGTSSGSTGAGSTAVSWPTTKFNATKKQIQQTIGSYKALNSQFSGNSTKNFFTPTTAQKWIKFVGSGACVYKFTNQQFCKYFGGQWNNNPSTTAAFSYLKKNFGAGIKGVCRGKGNTWLVAATKINGGPFKNYNWSGN